MSDECKYTEWEYADNLAKRVAASAMEYLIQSKYTLSGDGSALTNTWEEICVQVQGYATYYWEAYEAAMRDAVASALMQLDERELASIWLQTDYGLDWRLMIDNEEICQKLENLKVDCSVMPVDEDVVTDYIISKYLDQMAFEYSSSNIKAFLNPDEDLWDE